MNEITFNPELVYNNMMDVPIGFTYHTNHNSHHILIQKFTDNKFLFSYDEKYIHFVFADSLLQLLTDAMSYN